MRAAVLVILVLLASPLTVQAHAAETPGETLLDAGACSQGEPLAAADFPAWAEENGFGTPSRALAASAPQCPEIRSCNKTHCITTSACITRDLGVGTCCVGSACRSCPAGQTIQVTNCRCAGGGCVNASSQSLSCG